MWRDKKRLLQLNPTDPFLFHWILFVFLFIINQRLIRLKLQFFFLSQFVFSFLSISHYHWLRRRRKNHFIKQWTATPNRTECSRQEHTENLEFFFVGSETNEINEICRTWKLALPFCIHTKTTRTKNENLLRLFSSAQFRFFLFRLFQKMYARFTHLLRLD